MTREQYEEARKLAVYSYMDKANREMNDAALGRNRKANAKRRYTLCLNLTTKWDAEGFWTQENTLAYNMIYMDVPAGSPISPF